MRSSAFAAPAHAQNYPTKPIRLIVPFPPGGGTDFVARTVATELAKSTGWTVVVENKAGAAGMIGLVEAARAPHEGYDIVIGQADNMIIAPATMKNPGLDPAEGPDAGDAGGELAQPLHDAARTPSSRRWAT